MTNSTWELKFWQRRISVKHLRSPMSWEKLWLWRAGMVQLWGQVILGCLYTLPVCLYWCQDYQFKVSLGCRNRTLNFHHPKAKEAIWGLQQQLLFCFHPALWRSFQCSFIYNSYWMCSWTVSCSYVVYSDYNNTTIFSMIPSLTHITHCFYPQCTSPLSTSMCFAFFWGHWV